MSLYVRFANNSFCQSHHGYSYTLTEYFKLKVYAYAILRMWIIGVYLTRDGQIRDVSCIFHVPNAFMEQSWLKNLKRNERLMLNCPSTAIFICSLSRENKMFVQ